MRNAITESMDAQVPPEAQSYYLTALDRILRIVTSASNFGEEQREDFAEICAGIEQA